PAIVLCCVRHLNLSLRDLHSFPTRRSSDLFFPRERCGGAVALSLRRPARERPLRRLALQGARRAAQQGDGLRSQRGRYVGQFPSDRKSTRLNSSHSQISYAVFCLKKKT